MIKRSIVPFLCHIETRVLSRVWQLNTGYAFGGGSNKHILEGFR